MHEAGHVAEIVRFARSLGLARRRRRMPRQHRPSMIELDYARELLRFVDRARVAFAQVIAEAPHLLESAARDRHDSERADADEPRRLRDLIAQARERLLGSIDVHAIEQLARDVARRTEVHQKQELIRQTRAVLGVDVLLTDRKLAGQMEGFVAENVALIKSIPEEIATRVEKTITRGVASGLRWKDVATEVEADFAVGRQRAHTIARDQVMKFHGQVAETRQKDLGVTEYIWRTARDARVRGNPVGIFPRARFSHFDREGKRFKWSEPPPDGHPGQPILCRCWPEPVLGHLTAEEGAAPAEVAPEVAPRKRSASPKKARPVRSPEEIAESRRIMELAEVRRKESILRDGKVTPMGPLGGGANPTYLLEITSTDGLRAVGGVWKPAAEEVGNLRDNVTRGTYYKREAAAYNVADLMGVERYVPPTIVREIDGQVGSVQEFAERSKASAQRIGDAKADRAAMEKVRAFDYVIGNSDRHGQNLLWRQEGNEMIPVLIDHGLAFPEGAPVRFLHPVSHVFDYDGPLLESTKTMIASVDPRELNRRLVDAGIEEPARRAALERLIHLQRNPDMLSLATSQDKFASSRYWDQPSILEPGLRAQDHRTIREILRGD